MPGVLVLAYAVPPLALPALAWAYDRWRRRPDAHLAVVPAYRRSGLEAASE